MLYRAPMCKYAQKPRKRRGKEFRGLPISAFKCRKINSIVLGPCNDPEVKCYEVPRGKEGAACPEML